MAATVCWGAALAAGLWAGETAIDERVASVLQRDAALSPADIGTLTRDKPVARTLDKRDKRDLGVLGAVHVDVPPEYFLERFRDIRTFKRGRVVREIGTFSTVPVAGDLVRLSFERRDLESLEHCRVGDCDVRLSAGDIGRLRTDIPWSSPDRWRLVDAWWRERIAAYAAAYRKCGNTALITYADEKHPASLEAEFTAALHHSKAWFGAAPEFQAYLVQYPRSTLAGAEDFLYWSKEDVGAKPIVSVTHVTIYTPGGNVREHPTFIASKQVYASHYLDASLGLTMMVPSCEANNCSLYLAYMNRTRAELGGGIITGVVRSIVRKRATDGMKDMLVDLRDRLEADYVRAQPANGAR